MAPPTHISAMTKSERDYVLGTNDAEISRLSLQHQVWRPHVFPFWNRAGLTRGKTVIDAGAGPGFASLDLAEIVGPRGRIISVERSGRFLDTLKGEAALRGLEQIEAIESDLLEYKWPESSADFIWCRWVLAFVADPARVVAGMAKALKPGGAILFHEYCDYRAWRFAPPLPEMERFRELVISSWRGSGGEPDIALELPRLLPGAGLTLESAKALQFAITPKDFMWHWPESFIAVNLDRQVELGNLTRTEADTMQAAIEARLKDPASLMLTPSVMLALARKPV